MYATRRFSMSVHIYHIIQEKKRLDILNLFANLFYPVIKTCKIFNKQKQNVQITQKANNVISSRVNTEEDLLLVDAKKGYKLKSYNKEQ